MSDSKTREAALCHIETMLDGVKHAALVDHDSAMAHRHADLTTEVALEMIAAGCGAPDEVAALALTVNKIDFEWWYA